MRRVSGEEARRALERGHAEQRVPPEALERNRALFGEPLSPREAVERIVRDVRRDGDSAVLRYARLLDGVPERGIEVPRGEMEAARAGLEPALRAAIAHAARRLRDFHERQPAGGFLHETEQGALGQLVLPVDRAGVYAPAGASPLASSVLHTAIPAAVAGVPQIVVCSPPGRDGLVSAVTLAAAAEVGASRVFALGGPVAVAAMAYGTQTVPRVDKLGGPGNAVTVLAMRAVFGDVGVVSLPGPTETLVLADASADPRLIAADLLAQAEHAAAQPVLVAVGPGVADRVLAEVERQAAALPEPNRGWARDSLAARGIAAEAGSVAEGLELANLHAPEHLCLLVEDPWRWLPLVRRAGGVFVGEDSMEALGDYLAGPSHVMPTGGTARFSSPVNVRDFQRIVSVVGLNRRGLAATGADAARLARAEGLEAHARAIEARGRG